MKNLKKTDKALLALADELNKLEGDYATKDEVVAVFDAVGGAIKQLKSDFSEVTGGLSEETQAAFKEVIKDFNKKVSDLEGTIKGLEKQTKSSSTILKEELLNALQGQIEGIKMLIPTIPEVSFEPVWNRIKEVESKIPQIPDNRDLIEKITKAEEELSRLDDIERMAKANAMPITTTHFSRDNSLYGRAKNINMVGSKVEVVGDTAHITPVTVSDTAPENPFIGQLWVDTS